MISQRNARFFMIGSNLIRALCATALCLVRFVICTRQLSNCCLQRNDQTTTMSSKRETLHGIELDERPSPLKKKLGDLRVKDTNILGDGNYVDVQLEAVENSTNPKKRKTRAEKPAAPALICPTIFTTQNYDFAEPSTSENRK